MPRCQRTFFRLREPLDKRDAGTDQSASWRCAYCPDAETYETVADAGLIEYARFAEAECLRDFGAPRDASRPYSLLLGLHPECVLEREDGRYDIYLKRGSDFHQLRFQIGHEMFHRVCSEGRVFHGTHEMLASLAAVLFLRRYGLAEYADRVDAWYRSAAPHHSFAKMTEARMTAPPPLGGFGEASALPDSFYRSAYVAGADLLAEIGYPPLRRLARRLRRDCTPDVEGWLTTLDPGEREISARILGITMGTPK